MKLSSSQPLGKFEKVKFTFLGHCLLFTQDFLFMEEQSLFLNNYYLCHSTRQPCLKLIFFAVVAAFRTCIVARRRIRNTGIFRSCCVEDLYKLLEADWHRHDAHESI